MKLLVLIKEVPDTWSERRIDLSSGWVDREASDPVLDEISERALEFALSFKDANPDAEVVAISMGPSSITKSIRKALAMGADSAVHVCDDLLAGADLTLTAAVLSAAAKSEGFDVVITGNESTDGRGGMMAPMIAEHLGLPHLSFLNSAEIRDNQVHGERANEFGTMNLSSSLPAVISITESLPDPRFPTFRGVMSAKKKPLKVVSLSELSLDGVNSSAEVNLTATAKPGRTAGVKVVDSGTAGADLADFLASNRLI